MVGMKETAKTAERHALLTRADAALREGRAGDLRDSPDFRARIEAAAPRRKPQWHDMTGRALTSLREWLRGGFPEPMQATVEEVRRALDCRSRP